MNTPKKLDELTVLEINAEIGLRMEMVERAVFELNALRQRREVLAKDALSKIEPIEVVPPQNDNIL